MKYAIIAAGEGARMVDEGVATPKPLICLNGEPMIDRLIRLFAANDASSVSIIINEEMEDVFDHVMNTKYAIPLHVIRKSTPSSMHSFYELSHTLEGERFCLTTVDTVFIEEEFSSFIGAFSQCTADGLFAVTNYMDDEKPLYVKTDDNMTIQGFHDTNVTGAHFVSGGIYCLKDKSIPVLKTAIEAGIYRMRNYQRQIIESGLTLQAWNFSKIIDVDHAKDILDAEKFLKGIDNQNIKVFE